MLNKLILAGNLTKDPELRTTTSGKVVCDFFLASAREYKNEQGLYDADFILCEAWNEKAEFICKHFMKGRPMLIESRLKTDKWTDKDGNTRWKTYALVDKIHFMDKKPQPPNTESTVSTEQQPTEVYDPEKDPDGWDTGDLPF